MRTNWGWWLKVFNKEGETIYDDLFVSEMDALERGVIIANGQYWGRGYVTRRRGVKGHLEPSSMELYKDLRFPTEASHYRDGPDWQLKRQFTVDGKKKPLTIEALMA